MGRFIVKMRDHYAEWSTVVDAPVSYFMPLDEFKAYYLSMYGTEGMRGLDERLNRVESNEGCSSIVGDTMASLLRFNRAVAKETSIGERAMWRRYGPAAAKRDEDNSHAP